MKNSLRSLLVVTITCLSVILSSSLLAQSVNELLPFNPDFDGNGAIGSSDLVAFLPLYGSAFIAEGVIPVENGGTGVSTLDSVRLALNISVFSDITPEGEPNAAGLVSGELVVTGNMSQGEGSAATGADSQASGKNCIASGNYSQATNQNCTATGVCSSATGESTSAVSTASHSEGMLTIASGTAAHAEGYLTATSANYTHAEGYQTQASNTASHSEGWATVASGLYSHAENRNTIANSTCAHAEGEGTSALADAAHSEGFQTIAGGFASHAEGYQTEAAASYSHASGRSTIASGTASSAIGYNLVADQDNSTVVGQYNVEGQVGTLFVVGTGTGVDARANTFEVSTGSALVNGDLEVTGTVTIDGMDLMSIITVLQDQILDLQLQLDAIVGGE